MDNKYFPFLDSFRGVAILFVVISHMGLDYIVPGGFGVTLFFFISGFLITRLLIFEYEKKNSIDLKNFYIRRFLRLYPALLIMLFVSCILIFIFECQPSKTYFLSGLFYYTNYYILFFQQSSFICMWLPISMSRPFPKKTLLSISMSLPKDFNPFLRKLALSFVKNLPPGILESGSFDRIR